MIAEPIFPDVAPWPKQSDPLPPRDHNKPPLEELIPAEFREELLRERPDFMRKFDDLIGAADRAVANDDDTLGRCGDLVDGYRKLQNHIDAAHKVVKQPYLDGGRLVDAEKNVLGARIKAARDKVEAIGNEYVAKREAAARAERERVAAEQRAAAEAAARAERERVVAELEAQRAAAEATNAEERVAAEERAAQARRDAEEAMAKAALAPSVPTAPASLVRSDAGSTVSAKQEYECAVEDYSKAFRSVKNDAKVREAIDAAVKRLVKQTKGQLEISGVRIWPVSKANFR